MVLKRQEACTIPLVAASETGEAKTILYELLHRVERKFSRGLEGGRGAPSE